MTAPPASAGIRTHSRRTPLASSNLACSCGLLLELALREPVRSLLARTDVSPETLERKRNELHAVCDSEPADWRLRLRQRGAHALADDLEQLLAITRTADSHAYQLLEHAGISCAQLRRKIVAASPLRFDAEVPRETNAPDRIRAHPPRRASRDPAREDAAAGDTTETLTAPTTRTEPVSRPRALPIDPQGLAALHGRDAELAHLADALSRRSPRPTLLVGEHGSGRTLLASHLARVLMRPVVRLEAVRYEDEQALRADLDGVADIHGIAILDDLDKLAGDAAPPFVHTLMQAWGNDAPPVLAIVSSEGRARLQTWMPGLLDAVDLVTLAPLSSKAVHEAVHGNAPRVLAAHGVELAPDLGLGELTRWAERYLGGLALPGRALDLLDLVCARAVRHEQRRVRRETCLEVVSERSGIPRDRLEQLTPHGMLDLEQRIARRVVGHAHVVSTLAELVRRNRAGFASQRPIASVLLLGPSGVGKTEIAKALCEALFDHERALVRLDMSEYAEAHAVARIVGAPPGYVGHEQGGALTDPMLRQPHCVVLLDEIEKAHRDVHQLLLQVFDEGRLTDGRGRVVDFRHAIILMTSNLGADRLIEDPLEGTFDPEPVLNIAREAFPVELWNRIEAPLVMAPLRAEEMHKICRRLAKTSSERLFRERGIRYSLSPEACRHVVALLGRDPALGARPLRHLLAREVESVVADAVLRGALRAGSQALVTVERDRIVLR